MNWKKLVLPPLAIYAIIFLFISLLIGAKVDQTATWVWIVNLIITIVGFYWAVTNAKIKSIAEGFTYGVSWLVVLFILDLILTRPFTGWEYYADWRSYVPYVIALFLPLLWPKQAKTKKK